jgi:HSP20 family molecular chaperone IbpA
MYSTAWITSNDLSLTFDGRGRLWSFRSTTHRTPALDATVEGTELVITLDTPGAGPGDLAVELDGRVLKVTGETGSVRGLVATVGLPKRVELHALETAYGDDTFVVSVPLVPATVAAPETEAVPVAC